jgi:hypothetical protein
LRLIPLLFCLLYWSCANKQPTPKAGSSFPREQVVAASNLLLVIQDWPQSTQELQQRYGIGPVMARRLSLPLHPIWDEKIKQTSGELKQNPTALKHEVADCAASCSCDFYRQVLELNPSLMASFPLKYPLLTKEQRIACAKKVEVSQVLLKHLFEQLEQYEADAVM